MSHTILLSIMHTYKCVICMTNSVFENCSQACPGVHNEFSVSDILWHRVALWQEIPWVLLTSVIFSLILE